MSTCAWRGGPSTRPNLIHCVFKWGLIRRVTAYLKVLLPSFNNVAQHNLRNGLTFLLLSHQSVCQNTSEATRKFLFFPWPLHTLNPYAKDLTTKTSFTIKWILFYFRWLPLGPFPQWWGSQQRQSFGYRFICLLHKHLADTPKQPQWIVCVIPWTIWPARCTIEHNSPPRVDQLTPLNLSLPTVCSKTLPIVKH